MSESVQPQASESAGNAEPTADEELTPGGRLGLLLLVFVVLAVITVELGRFLAFMR